MREPLVRDCKNLSEVILAKGDFPLFLVEAPRGTTTSLLTYTMNDFQNGVLSADSLSFVFTAIKLSGEKAECVYAEARGFLRANLRSILDEVFTIGAKGNTQAIYQLQELLRLEDNLFDQLEKILKNNEKLRGPLKDWVRVNNKRLQSGKLELLRPLLEISAALPRKKKSRVK